MNFETVASRPVPESVPAAVSAEFDETAPAKISPGENPAAPARLLSLDAFRGADMLCILGLDAFAHALARVFPDCAFCKEISAQFSHKPWEGLAAYDLVFPAFVFISGVAMAFSFEKKRGSGAGTGGIAVGLLRRALILVALGAILQGALSFDVAGTRFASVLGLIGIANAIGGLLALFLKTPKKIAAACVAVSAGVACAQIFGGDFTRAGTLNAKLDALLLPGKFHNGNYDPEGVLCVVSASVAVLAGVLVGISLQKRKGKSGAGTALRLAGFGAIAIVAAFAAGTHYPIIKSIWTQTFVWAAVGWSALAFAVFYFVFDVLRAEKLAFFFKVIGVNAITIYVLQWIFPFGKFSELLFGGIAGFFGNGKILVLVAGAVALKWLLLFFLNRRKIFIKI